MRTARLLTPLTAAAVVLPLLAGCGGSSGGGSAASASGSSGSSSASSAAATGSGGSGGSGKAVACTVAPADLVGTALGDKLTGPTQTRNGDTIVVCDYKGATTGLVKLRIQTDSDAASFAVEKKGFATQGMKTTDVAFADEAFSNVLGSGSYAVTSLIARKGSVELLVTGKSTVAREQVLLTTLFGRL